MTDGYTTPAQDAIAELGRVLPMLEQLAKDYQHTVNAPGIHPYHQERIDAIRALLARARGEREGT